MATEAISLKLKGDKELQRALLRAGPKAAKASLRTGIRAMARVIIKDARKRLSARYRTISKALNVRVGRATRGGERIDAIVGPTVGRAARFNAWYAHFIEKGVEPFDIGIRTKKVLAETFRGGRGGGVSYGRTFGTELEHPGIDARPFLGPAFRARAAAAIKASGQKMWATLEKRLRKLS